MSTLLWILLLLVGLLWLFKRWKMVGHPPVPGPKGWPIIGCSLGFFDRTPAGMTTGMLDLAKNFASSPVVKLENIILTSYLITDAHWIQELCVNKAQEYINHPTFPGSEKMLTTKSLIGIRDDVWRSRRRQLSPHFTATKIVPMVSELFVNHARALVSRLDSAKDGETVNIQQYFTNMTMDVIGDAAFGTDFGAQANPDNVVSIAVRDWLDAAARVGFLAVLPHWDKIPMKSVQQFFTGQKLLADMCAKVVDERVQSGTTRNDLVQSLVELEGIERNHLLGEALLFLVAGHETTSTTLTWATYMICKHPEIEKRIIDEIDKVLGDEIPNPDNVHNLKYLDMVVQETLRYHPPALITTRENSERVKVDNFIFPPKTMFLIPIWALHHDARYWEDPEKFDPERWTPENKAKHVHGAYLPFGLGPRMCIGYKFALMEAKVALAMLYQKYSFKYTQPGDPLPKLGTLWRTERLLVDVHRR